MASGRWLPTDAAVDKTKSAAAATAQAAHGRTTGLDAPTADGHSTGSSLTIGTYNCEGFLTAAHYIVDQLLSQCDILFLSEVWLSRAEETYLPSVVSSLDSSDFCYVQQFAMELPPRAGEGRPRGGVALICRRRPGISFRTVDCGDARLCGVTVLAGVRPILSVVGCYMPYWDSSGSNVEEYAEVTGKLDSILSSLRVSAPTVLLGDFNCALCPLPRESRPSAWHRLHGFNPNSVAMQDLLDDYDLNVAEFSFRQPVTYTFSRAGNYSHIDHIAVPDLLMPQVLGCTILPPDENNLSPHLPLICRLAVADPAGTDRTSHHAVDSASCTDVLDWSCAEKIESYKIILDKMLTETLPECGESLNDLDAAISRCIHAAARAAGCSKPRRPAKSWWTPSAAAARDRSRFWHRLWVSCGRPSSAPVADCYREARRSYRRARRKAALSQIEKEARLLRLLRRDRNLTAFWRRVQLARRGGLPAGSDCCVADFQAHFKAVHHDSREQLSDDQRFIADAVEARVLSARAVVGERTVSPEQVTGLLRLLHPGKAPGVDGVTPEHLLLGSTPTLRAALARLMTGCLSTCAVPATFSQSAVVPLLKNSHLDPNSLDNYRPISITTCASKLLELLILEELQSSFIPHDLQFGFISNRGTAEASLLIGETIQYNRRIGLPVFAANLDARKCFDRIWYEPCFDRIWHDGLFYRLMQHLNAQTTGSWSSTGIATSPAELSLAATSQRSFRLCGEPGRAPFSRQPSPTYSCIHCWQRWTIAASAPTCTSITYREHVMLMTCFSYQQTPVILAPSWTWSVILRGIGGWTSFIQTPRGRRAIVSSSVASFWHILRRGCCPVSSS